MTRSNSPAPDGDRIDFQINGGPDLGVISGNVFSEETMYAVMQAAADRGWPVRPYQTMTVDQLVRAMLNAAGIDSRAGLSDTNLLGLVKATGYYTELAARLHTGDAPAVETSEYAPMPEQVEFLHRGDSPHVKHGSDEAYEQRAPFVFLHRGDSPHVKHGSDEAYEQRAPFVDARRAFRDGWDSAIAELLNEVIRVQSVAVAPSNQTSEDDMNYYRNHALAHPMNTGTRAAVIQWLADKVAR